MKLTTIDDVSEEEAEILKENGIKYLEDLAGARCLTIEEMGLSADLVADALVAVNHAADFIDKDEIGYECQYCGEEFAGIQSHSHDRHVRYECEQRPDADGVQFAEEVA